MLKAIASRMIVLDMFADNPTSLMPNIVSNSLVKYSDPVYPNVQ